jgi:hypothetical protein
MTITTTNTVTYGTRPVGSCAPDGRTLWATRSRIDGGWKFTSYDGWLITGETTTTDKGVYVALDDYYANLYGQEA